MQVRLEFEEFFPVFRGQYVPEAGPVVPRKIHQMGIMVSKFGERGGGVPNFKSGNFRLGIKHIELR